MASFQNLDSQAKALIEKSYPQAVQADGDTSKISKAAFPGSEVVHLCQAQSWL